MKEIWKNIKNYEGLYQISNLGNIRSVDRYINSPLNNQDKVLRKGKILTANTNKRNGYVYIFLYKENQAKSKRIHRLVAEAFIPNPNNYPQINHIDGNKQNNKVDNLEWCTSSHNLKHAYKHNLNNGNKRKIIQLDKELNVIKEWNSIKEASEKLNIERANIIACCKCKLKRAGGYVWKYI